MFPILDWSWWRKLEDMLDYSSGCLFTTFLMPSILLYNIYCTKNKKWIKLKLFQYYLPTFKVRHMSFVVSDIVWHSEILMTTELSHYILCFSFVVRKSYQGFLLLKSFIRLLLTISACNTNCSTIVSPKSGSIVSICYKVFATE